MMSGNTIKIPPSAKSDYKASSRRYLEFMPEPKLRERIQDAFDNCYTFENDGEPRLRGGIEKFQILIAHALAEAELRNIQIEKKGIAKLHPSAKRAAELWKSVGILNRPYLLKFMKRRHAERAYLYGEFRVSPARSYLDPWLNAAIRDDETSFREELYGPEITIHFPESGGVYGPTSPIGNVVRNRECENFYVFCLASSWDHRLFGDFEYDSCVVIKDMTRFTARMTTAASNALTKSTFYADYVEYRDPMHPDRDPPDVRFTKYFKYTYQQEYRFVWMPDTRNQELAPVDLSIGTMESYSQLLVL